MEEKHFHDHEQNCCTYSMIEINQQDPSFKAEAFHNGRIKDVSLKDFKEKWIVLFFYPADFTFVCPTELGDLADSYEKIKNLGGEILAVSTDTVFAHKAWHDTSKTINKIKFPMIADPSHKISKSYGVYIPEEGVALRGSFIIDPEGILKTIEIHENSIGRSADELIRKLEAAKFVKEHGGEVCPSNWKPGSKTLKPGLDLVGKI
jgi:NADH-dependent peroxiredoxin subunit C